MRSLIVHLNKDQSSGLATLCFDLAKVSFAFVLFPTLGEESSIQLILKILISILAGLAFTYFALILLGRKGRE